MPKGAINITDRTWLISEEITNLDDKENIFEMSYESRALDTDILDAPPGHVITGNKASLISECVELFYHFSKLLTCLLQVNNYQKIPLTILPKNYKNIFLIIINL